MPGHISSKQALHFAEAILQGQKTYAVVFDKGEEFVSGLQTDEATGLALLEMAI